MKQVHAVVLHFLQVLLQSLSLHPQQIFVIGWVRPDLTKVLSELRLQETNPFLNEAVFVSQQLKFGFVGIGLVARLVDWHVSRRQHTLELVRQQLLLDLLELALQGLILSYQLLDVLLPFLERPHHFHFLVVELRLQFIDALQQGGLLSHDAAVLFLKLPADLQFLFALEP